LAAWPRGLKKAPFLWQPCDHNRVI